MGGQSLLHQQQSQHVWYSICAYNLLNNWLYSSHVISTARYIYLASPTQADTFLSGLIKRLWIPCPQV